MSEYLMRGFRAQVTTSMDSVLRRAVFEIMMIFENSVHDHQKELAQKGEEIAHLKIKLQRAELKLKESECGGDREADMSTFTINETQREPEDVLTAPGQTSDVPEIDFEVPDDWCAPLGCETVAKQEESVCPSIRLRKLSIPLWPIPIIKQEVVNCDIDDSHQQTEGLRRSRRGSSLNEGHKHMDRTLPMRGRGTRRPPMRNDMRQLLEDIKQEYTDLTGNAGHRGKGRNVTGKEQENTTKSKKEKRKTAATESREKEMVKNGGEKSYSCKFCKKVFDTPFGRSVHVRSHKKCRGCKKEYRFPSALQLHKQTCKKLKQLLAKQAESTNPPKLESCDEENPTAPSKKQLIDEKESPPFSSNISESSIQKDRSTKKNSCVYCNKTFHRRSKLKEHVRVHTGERPFPCDMCSKKFRVNQALKKHIMRIHKDQMNSSETNENVASTEPLEDTEDDQEDLRSPKKDTSLAINHNNVQRDCSSDTRPSPGWQTMGRRCPDGFICLLCQKVSKSKYRMIEHFRTHTGEKPIKCERCPAVFRFRGQLSLHKKKCRQPMEGTQCAKCEKIFRSQAKYNKHVSKCRRDLPILCKVCGKGFFYKGRLENHMERYHK
ncbi:zinc finger protein 62-like [Perca fluviatilis]|uniref:zinc finger protein 62-like n=1 Tax=Perca fluviatilis TaxID=8168 RepID=UPI001963AE32|nr:zinc finger protein 62-like [Perca fluviatilis]XP_039669112.1 zinc finger protein 62-like [Perca fluviatilis]